MLPTSPLDSDTILLTVSYFPRHPVHMWNILIINLWKEGMGYSRDVLRESQRDEMAC